MHTTVPARYNPAMSWSDRQQAETAMVLGGAAAGGLLGLTLWYGVGSRAGRWGALFPIVLAAGGALLWTTLIPGE